MVGGAVHELGHPVLRRIGGKALVHPGIVGLVGAQRRVVPHVRKLMHSGPQHRAVAAFFLEGRAVVAAHDGEHRVFHAAVAPLGHRHLRIGVVAVFLIEIRRELRHVVSERAPLLGHARLVENVVRGAVLRHFVVDVRGIGRPREVVDVLGGEVPGERVGIRQAVRRTPSAVPLDVVAVPDFFGVLKDARGTDRVLGGKGDLNVKIAVGRVVLAVDVEIGVPAPLVVFRHLGVPLRHGVVDLVAPTVAPAPPRLQGHLRAVVHDERGRLARSDGLRQVHAQDRLVDLVGHRFSVLRE